MNANQEGSRSGAAPRGQQRCSLGIIFLGLTGLLAGCASLSPISDDARTLQEQIRTGEALKQGDRVRVVTHDGVSHRITVAYVKGDVLTGHLDTPTPVRTGEPEAQALEQEKGPLVEIPIADIVLVEKEQVSAGKTAAVGGGVLLVFLALSAAAAMAAVMTP